jgi:hypothetical protein
VEFLESITYFFQNCRDVGILMEENRWETRLETYQGASWIVRRTFDWKVWMRAILEGLAEPHSGTHSMRYVQVCFRIVLHIVSLLVRPTVDDLCNSLCRSP